MKAKSIVMVFFFAGCFFYLPHIAKADEPLPPPADYLILSQNKKFKAFFSVENKTTTVYEIQKIKRREKLSKIWEMPGWFRNTFLSNDGDNLVVAYDGANLLELDYKPEQVMISFYSRGQLLNEVRLNQLIENPVPEKLVKTVSHYQWVSTYGLNSGQVFEVNTISKKRFLFDVKSGLPVGTPLYSSIGGQEPAKTEDNQTANSPELPNNSNEIKDSNQSATHSGNCPLAFLAVAGFAVSLPKLAGTINNFHNRQIRSIKLD